MKLKKNLKRLKVLIFSYFLTKNIHLEISGISFDISLRSNSNDVQGCRLIRKNHRSRQRVFRSIFFFVISLQKHMLWVPLEVPH